MPQEPALPADPGDGQPDMATLVLDSLGPLAAFFPPEFMQGLAQLCGGAVVGQDELLARLDSIDASIRELVTFTQHVEQKLGQLEELPGKLGPIARKFLGVDAP